GCQRHGNGATFRARGYAVSTVGCEEGHLRRYLRNQEQLDIQGRDEDGGGEESLRTCIWQPLGLLTTVKPPALRERHDLMFASYRRELTIRRRISKTTGHAPESSMSFIVKRGWPSFNSTTPKFSGWASPTHQPDTCAVEGKILKVEVFTFTRR